MVHIRKHSDGELRMRTLGRCDRCYAEDDKTKGAEAREAKKRSLSHSGFSRHAGSLQLDPFLSSDFVACYEAPDL